MYLTLGNRLRNCFPSYVCLKDMYITLKRIGKILFGCMLRILLICKFLKFTTVFTKKLNFPKFVSNTLCEKVNFSLIQPTRFWQLSVKVTFKWTVKNNDYWMFLIFFVFTLVFHLELETRKGWIVERVQLYIRAAAGHELAAIETCAQSFNLWLIS